MYGDVGGKDEEDTEHNYDNRQYLTTEIMVTRQNDSVVTMVSSCHDIEPFRMAKRWSQANMKSIDITQQFVIDQ